MKTLLYPTYFPSISHYVALIQAREVVFEVEDNFQKQTNRNRMYIYSPNGIQLLNIPVKHSKIGHQKTKDIQIESNFNWQKQHFKSLEAAYRTSPFFEYFEDDILPVFEKKHTFLMDLNFEVFEIVNRCLGIEIPYQKTHEYFHEVENSIDLRILANGKRDTTVCEPYTQVFDDKHGFISNLSILDLLFNEGRLALDYVKNQKLPPTLF
ncbi:WbqC family protein [Flavobacterium sp.]|uniref:WbqC family protein n=1 Tax=Flavobacterium sp. TaxID=239 RepID=UPI002FDA26DF